MPLDSRLGRSGWLTLGLQRRDLGFKASLWQGACGHPVRPEVALEAESDGGHVRPVLAVPARQPDSMDKTMDRTVATWWHFRVVRSIDIAGSVVQRSSISGQRYRAGVLTCHLAGGTTPSFLLPTEPTEPPGQSLQKRDRHGNLSM